LLIGTLQLARALTDRDLSDQLLAQGVETALKLLDDRVPSTAGATTSQRRAPAAPSLRASSGRSRD
jgi:hypothetical protein